MDWTPPTIPARLPGWERAYVEIMERYQAEPFGWADLQHCLGAPAELTLGMTGVNPVRGLPARKTEEGQLRLLAKLGYRTVEDALEAVFPEIPKLLARRGDCGILDQTVDGREWPATFIVLGDRAIGKSVKGIVVVPTGRLKRTFAIGAP